MFAKDVPDSTRRETACRDLTHLSRFHDRLAPPTSSADSAPTTCGLPQLGGQLNSAYLTNATPHDPRRHRPHPGEFVPAAAGELGPIDHDLRDLTATLDTAHNHSAHLGRPNVTDEGLRNRRSGYAVGATGLTPFPRTT